MVSLATGPAHPSGWTAPETNDAAQLGGGLLAYILLGLGSQTDLTQVFGAFAELHMVETDGQTLTPAKTVIVLGHGTMTASDYAGQAELALVAASPRPAGTSSWPATTRRRPAADWSRWSASRRPSGRPCRPSTTPTTPSGQLSAVLALAGSTKGQVGHYGTGKGADALFPAPSK